MTISLVGLDPFLADLIMTGAIERLIHEALVSETLFRTDVKAEEFGGRIGETKLITRNGLLPIGILPLLPGVDPSPKTYAKEAFRTTLQRWGDTVDIYLPHDYIGVQKESAEKAKAIGMNAAQTVDRIVRQALYRAYLAGNTVATTAAIATALQVHVASLNGFTELNSATNGQPVTVSSANPLTVGFGGAEPDNTVVDFSADDPAAPFGPGWITLGAALTAGVSAREAVMAANRSNVIFAGGGNSVDALGAGDTLSLTDIINAVSSLRAAPKVPTFPDGMFHAHLSPYSEGQLLLDPLVRGMIGTDRIPDFYRRYALGELAGALFLRNPEVPDSFNSGMMVSTSTDSAQCSPEIGGELVNHTGIRVGLTYIYGQGHAYEEFIPPGATPPEVDIDKRQIAIPASSSGISLNTDRIEFILRPPFDRMGEITAFSWKFIGDILCASDITTSSRRFRRGVIIAHAIG